MIFKIKNQLYVTLLIAGYLLPEVTSADEYRWQLVNNENEIQVYIAETENSSIVIARTVTTIMAPMLKVQELLDNVDYRHHWVPFLKTSKLLQRMSENEQLEYSHFSAPWPASDRDFVYKLELIAESENKQIYKMHSQTSDLKPESKELIRAELFESTYTLTNIDQYTTQVELTFHADPKGWIPDWIVNIIQRVLPYKILENLRLELDAKP